MSVPGVAVLGSLNMDLVVETPGPAGPGETRGGTRFYTTPGGKGANQAVAAARILGDRGRVTMIGRVGLDPYGDDLIGSLRAAGVDTRYVRRDPERHSGVAVIFIDAQGENYVNAVYGANDSCDQQQVADARGALKDATVLLVQQEIPPDVSFRVMTRARSWRHRHPRPGAGAPVPSRLFRRL